MVRFLRAVKVDDVAGGAGVSRVDFSEEKKAIAWLEMQSVGVRLPVARRCAFVRTSACSREMTCLRMRFLCCALSSFLLFAGRDELQKWIGWNQPPSPPTPPPSPQPARTRRMWRSQLLRRLLGLTGPFQRPFSKITRPSSRS